MGARRLRRCPGLKGEFARRTFAAVHECTDDGGAHWITDESADARDVGKSCSGHHGVDAAIRTVPVAKDLSETMEAGGVITRGHELLREPLRDQEIRHDLARNPLFRNA